MTSDWRRRTIVAYLDEPPFCEPIGTGEPTGCDIDVARHVLTTLGVDSIEWVLVTFGELIPGVRAGRWHINTPMFVTPERAKLITYSRPVWAAVDGFIVRSSDRRDFSSYEAIAADPSIRLAAVTGQIQVRTALDVGVPRSRIVPFDDQATAALAVKAGHADASVSTAPGSFAYVARAGDGELVAVIDQRASERGPVAVGAFSFRKDAADLAPAFDDALGRLLGSERHLAMMASYGFSAEALDPALRKPVSPASPSPRRGPEDRRSTRR